MKILIVTQYYWPENSRVTDIAESLQKEGNKVTVLTGIPNYPQGYVYDGYKNGENRIQDHNGVYIIRAKLIERRNDTFHRLLNYYSFPYYAGKIARKMESGFDVVLAVEESPIMLVKPAIIYAKKHKKPLIMYGMDLWPESLLAGGVDKGSLIFKYYKKVSAKLYSRFDKILVTTEEHIDYIKSLKGCAHLDIDYLPQYADTVFEESDYETLDNGVIDLMFAGNIGKAQAVDTIIKAAADLKDDHRIRFHIVGAGIELNNVKKMAEELKATNVIFHGIKPLDEMPELYRLADAMLVTLEDKPYANMTIPGKIQSYMAAGKPIIGAINGSCANFILKNEIGYVCPSCDSHALANIIINLNKNDLSRLGKKAREVYFEELRKSLFVKKLLSHIQKLTS